MRSYFFSLCAFFGSLALSKVAIATPESAPRGAAAQGLGIGGFFGALNGRFAVGGQITSPRFIDVLRAHIAGGVGFYPDGLASDPDASWTPFGLGQVRIEAGPRFHPGVPLRPYSFGGLILAFLPEKLSDERVAVGGMGGIGIEVAHFPPEEGAGAFTYGIELAGVGSGASAATPAGNENLLSGLMVNASIRGYLW